MNLPAFQLVDALSTVGFVYLKNHRISGRVIDHAFRVRGERWREREREREKEGGERYKDIYRDIGSEREQEREGERGD